MAERRMFAKSIINSARFLRMPPSSRLLYYDLGMQADDDGVVEAFTVMRTTGATEDDLRILCSKGFIVVLNEDLVSYITDWKRNNLIKNDRYHPSVYADLLVQIQGGTQAEPAWNPSGTQVEPEVSIGKSSIGQVREGEDREDEDRGDDPSSPSPSPSALKVISYFVKHGGKELSQSAVAELEGYISDMGAEVCLKAVDAAIDAGMVGWGYVRGVLIKKQSQGVQSVEDWDRVEAERDTDKTIRDSRKEGRFSWAELAVQMDEEEQLVTLDDVPKFRARSALEDYA